jgi:hypothetical protein
MDFETRAHFLEEPGEGWAEDPRRLHLQARESVRAGLRRECGSHNLETKIADFTAIGSKPFSVLSYHNQFFDHVRRSIVIGA